MSRRPPGSPRPRLAEGTSLPSPIHELPRNARPTPVRGPRGSISSPVEYGAHQSAHHSETLPCISCRPHGFGGSEPAATDRPRIANAASAYREQPDGATAIRCPVANSDRAGRHVRSATLLAPACDERRRCSRSAWRPPAPGSRQPPMQAENKDSTPIAGNPQGRVEARSTRRQRFPIARRRSTTDVAETRVPRSIALALLLLSALAPAAAAHAAPPAACESWGRPHTAALVELCAEGCSRCPPADRWLRTDGALRPRPDRRAAAARGLLQW